MGERLASDIAADLDELDDDAFRDLVVQRLDAEPAHKPIWKVLCHPALVDRTAGCLEELVEELERAIARKGLGPGHFKTRQLAVVKTRLRQVSAATVRSAQSVNEPEVVKGLVRQLTLAIDAHRQACIGLNLAPEPHDLALWEVLDELRLPENGDAEGGPSLAEQIAAGRWRHPQAVSQ